MTSRNLPSNIPNPDPSVRADDRLEEAKIELRREMESRHEEAKGWVERLQLLLEKADAHIVEVTAEKIKSAEEKTISLDRVVQTRLAGSETALNAAMAAADKVTQKIEINFGAVMAEMKAGMMKQFDTIKEAVDDLKEGMSATGGRNIGATSTVLMIIAGISALAAVVSVAVTLSRPSPIEVHSDSVQQHHIKVIARW